MHGLFVRENANIYQCKKKFILYSRCCYLDFLALLGGVLLAQGAA